MLLNNFFHIVCQHDNPDGLTVQVQVNPDHEIYKAHFPTRPITPGVCQIQMVTELLSLHLGSEMELVEIKNVKYLAVISPDETTEITIRFLKMARDEDDCKVSVVLSNEEQLFSKMSMTYHVVRNHSNI